MRSLVSSAAALVLAVTPLAAQQAGTVELGLFGRQNWFGSDYALEDRAGVGARLGIFVLRNLALEANGTFIPTALIATGDKVKEFSGRGLLEYNIPAGPVGFILGGGIAFNSFSGDVLDGLGVSDKSEIGPVGLLGMRFGVGGSLQARVDGTYEQMSSKSDLSSDKDGSFGLQAGLSYLTGQSKPKVTDSDSDGVPDTIDQCPNTPLGTQVDGKGCPIAAAAPQDADGDRVLDSDDRCPNTPAGEAVDQNGCSDSQKDDDRDGVMNNRDRCPNTPAGETVDANGCSNSQKDDDRDGVVNTRDRCPNTPAGETVDANGCGPSQRDTDGDGVTDDKDKCPSTNPGNPVDAVGCRIINQLILKGVNFETGKAVITPESESVLNDVAEAILANPGVKIEVGGHTDNTGSAAINRRLSLARANAVKDYFVGKGVPADQLTARGYGPSKPVATNGTAAGRAENRRVELNVLP